MRLLSTRLTVVPVLLGLLSATLFSSAVQAADVMVAVASNFSRPMQKIAADFEKDSGHKVLLAFGSSGKFLAQIENGAPFDVFLSADQAKPRRLEGNGFAVAGSRFTYAQGRLALWSATAGDDVQAQLKAGSFSKLALANPRLAPYGQAATEVLEALQLSTATRNKQVMGENISQTWQFVATGNAGLGFVALSQVMSGGHINNGSVWIVPDNLYQPIRQDAVLLKKGEPNPAARAFLAFLQSAEVTELIRGYGYHRE
ncbi:MAG: molybdate ABC transporter substrate-binding protein [Thalassobium sp.]|nr:MAG: molybdate ABC transporter substrate-binding protein [Thalassobium sp.]